MAFVGAEKFSEFYITLHFSVDKSIQAGTPRLSNVRALPISLFADYTDIEWNRWSKQLIPIMRPIMTPIMKSRLWADILTQIRKNVNIYYLFTIIFLVVDHK